MNIKDLSTYELQEEKDIKDINAKAYRLKHIKSGARIIILSNDDDNKVFNIGFRTPPEDSTGLPHILEHSVLCGSKNFPAKDPFVELVKGSLNTFLNAMTYPDKTLYPVASYNDKDFQNLMNVYMDAVFFPNIYEKEEIFRQEGWNYNLESLDDKLTYNGVVYNEMKGAFSSPEGVLDREILNSLFPDTAYSHESGGDPRHIPELTYSQFLSFHSKYYHPANSYIYLYGDMDVIEKLQWLDKEYLSKYDAMPISSEIKLQQPFTQVIEVNRKYSIGEEETLEDNTYLSYNKVIQTSLDTKLCVAFQILEYSLLSAPGAPLKQVLLDEKLGKDVFGSYDNGVYQPIFSVVIKNANLSSKEKFIQLTEDTLRDIAEKGIDKKALQAGINYLEFKFREADYGSYPKGLIYGLELYNSWLYDEEKPFLYLELLDVFEFLKAQVDTGYFETLIKEHLLNNNHASIVIIEPEKGLTAKIDREVELKLQQYKDSLSKEALEQMVENTKKLVIHQETPSTKEELEAIPLLNREDIDKEVMPFSNTEYDFDKTLVLHHNLYTNGIGYLNLLFDLKEIPADLIPYLGILKAVLGYVDTKNYKYGELFNEINCNTGGIQATVTAYANLKEVKEFQPKFELKAKFLYEKLGFAFQMIKEILFTSNVKDEKRLYEIIAQLKSRLQMQLNSAGHSSAATRAMSYFSATANFNDSIAGITFYKVIENIECNFETEKADLIGRLQALIKLIFTKENLMVSFTADDTGFEPLQKEVAALKEQLYEKEVVNVGEKLPLSKKNEGFTTASQVQYVARAGNFINEGYAYTGALRILKVILSYDYLWQNVRVKGGAYGCMSGFTKTGDSYFVSYRDPNLEKTNQVYEDAIQYIKDFSATERDMTKYVIGTISDMDTPLTPVAKGARSLLMYLSNQSLENLQEERDEVLNATIEDIQKLANLVEAILKDNHFCVLGNEAKIKEQKDLFMKVLPLIN